jgi:periplasmic protein TonB
MGDRSEDGPEDPPWVAKGPDALAAFDRDIGQPQLQLQLPSWLISFGLHLTLALLLVKGSANPAFDKGAGDDVLKDEAAAIAVEMVTTDELPWLAGHSEHQTEVRKPLAADPEAPGVAAVADEPTSPPQSAAAQEATAPPQPATTAAAEPSAGPQIEPHRAVDLVGGNASMFSAYLGVVHAKIERTKVNPHSKIAGTVVVRFEVASSGTLLSQEIVTSSGSRILDDAALASLQRAAPFPPMPVGAAEPSVVLTMPFRFRVK